MPRREPKGRHRNPNPGSISMLNSNVKKMKELGEFFKKSGKKKQDQQPIVFHLEFATLLNTDHLVTSACKQLMDGDYYCTVQCSPINGLCVDEAGNETGVFIVVEVYVLSHLDVQGV